MIEIPKLSEKDLEIYRGKTVLIDGFSERSVQLYQIFSLFQIKAKVLKVANDARRFSELDILGVFMGIPVISREKMSKLLENGKDVIIQTLETDDKCMEGYAEKYRVEISPYSYGQIAMSFSYVSIFKLFNNPITYKACELYWKIRQRNLAKPSWKTHKIAFQNTPVFICSPPKTADFSLAYTFQKLNEQRDLYAENYFKIDFCNLWHKPRTFSRQTYAQKYGKVKMIVGLREPIAQNLSMCYQKLASGNVYFDWLLGILVNTPVKEKKLVLKHFLKMRDTYGNDAQVFWNEFVERFVYVPNDVELLSFQPNSIQNFMKEFQENVYDIEKVPFNKEKGFGVVKENDLEIFIYQLEKLNNLAPELSAWIGVPFDTLEKGNDTNDKWIGESYKQAQQEIEITQEYFDRCFDELYVKHCYSEVDIEKFKAKWQSHIVSTQNY